MIGLPGGASANALYDTGAMISLMSEESFRKIPVDRRPERTEGQWLELCGVDQKPLAVKGLYSLPVAILGRKVVHKFYVVKDLSSEVIIGADFIHKLALPMIQFLNPFFTIPGCLGKILQL